MKVAAIDMGSNSVRLLIGEWDGESINTLHTRLETTRLGSGMGEERRLSRAAIDKTLAVLADYKVTLDSYGIKAPVIGATSAVREAANAGEFSCLVRAETGWDLWIMSGEEEALASFTGAVRGLAKPVDKPLIVDIGGGSTEVIWREGESHIAGSVPVGAVRMTEKGSSGAEIENLLAPLFAKVPQKVDVIGVGGTVTTLAAISLGLKEYDSSRVHGYYLAGTEIDRLTEYLASLSLEDRRKIPGLAPSRADIIVAGALIAQAARKLLDCPGFTVSDQDILYGLVYLDLKK